MTLEQRIEALEKNLEEMKAQNEATVRALDALNAHCSSLAVELANLEVRTSNFH